MRSLIAGGAVLLAVTACGFEAGGQPPASTPPAAPSVPPNAIDPHPPSATAGPATQPPTSEPPSDLPLADLTWYEVRRIGDRDGNQSRSLIYGTLNGKVSGQLPLAQQTPAERRDGTEPFRWTDPQVAGVFDDRALVWGRGGDLASLEALDLHTGEIENLLDVEGAIHVATANADFTRLFFVTANADSAQPSGLWTHVIGDTAGPSRIDYPFGDEELSNEFKYRLAASDDGSLVAIQPDEGSVTLIDVSNGPLGQVDPGGPMVGFAGERLVSLTAEDRQELRDVVVFDPATLDGEVQAESISTAQIVPSDSGGLLAVMRLDLRNPANFEILGVAPETGESWTAYIHDEPVAAALLPREDRTFVEVERPLGWASLVETIAPFISSDGQPAKKVPESQYPKLLHLMSGEVRILGPFEEPS